MTPENTNAPSKEAMDLAEQIDCLISGGNAQSGFAYAKIAGLIEGYKDRHFAPLRDRLAKMEAEQNKSITIKVEHLTPTANRATPRTISVTKRHESALENESMSFEYVDPEDMTALERELNEVRLKWHVVQGVAAARSDTIDELTSDLAALREENERLKTMKGATDILREYAAKLETGLSIVGAYGAANLRREELEKARDTIRTRPVTVQAVQWWNHGDHDKVSPSLFDRNHGCMFVYFAGREFAVRVRPGDWIVTHPNGSVEHVPASEFNQRFEEVK